MSKNDAKSFLISFLAKQRDENLYQKLFFSRQTISIISLSMHKDNKYNINFVENKSDKKALKCLKWQRPEMKLSNFNKLNIFNIFMKVDHS